MLKKLLLGSLLLISLLRTAALASSYYDEPRNQLIINPTHLRNAFNNQKLLEIENGRGGAVKVSITNALPTDPDFSTISDDPFDFFVTMIGLPDPIQSGRFSFVYNKGVYEKVYNSDTGQWIDDVTCLIGHTTLFSLNAQLVTDESAPSIHAPLSTVSENRQPAIDKPTYRTESNILEGKKQALQPSQKADQSEKKEEEKTTLFRVMREPNEISSMVNKDARRVKYLTEQKLWLVLEPVTERVAGWWLQRLGYEAYFQYNNLLKKEEQEISEMPIEHKMQIEEGSQVWDPLNGVYTNKANCLFSRDVHEARDDFFPLRFSSSHEEQEGMDPGFIDLCTSPSRLTGDFLGAWRGLKYNLAHHKTVPTWVAYFSSIPVDNISVYEKFPVTSRDIKMMMTVTISENFESRLGISSSPIGSTDGHHRQLSMPFHAGVADFTSEINPNLKYVVIRPLLSMKQILKKSGIAFSESNGYSQDISYPYILKHPENEYYSNNEAFFKRNKDELRDVTYALVDPRTHEVHQIDSAHWFSHSPFLGGASQDSIDKYPFLISDIEVFKALR